MRNHARVRIFMAALLIWLCSEVQVLIAQDAEQPVKPDYVPASTADPQLPLDQLRILVKPLIKSELEAEADAWFELLRQKARQIAAVQLGVKKTNATTSADNGEAAEAATAAAEMVNGEADAAEAAEAADVVEGASGMKEELLVGVTELQSERTALANRLEVVLASLEAKGGKVQEYRDYMLAVSGIALDATDASATWVALTGWLTSKEGGQRWLWNIGLFLTILLVSYVIAKIAANVTNWLLERKLELSQLAEDLISRTIKNVLMVVGFAVALTALEIDITPIIAAIGAAGFIIGFALQGTLSNFASGLMILVNKPFDVGDAVNAGGVTGIIHQMSLVSTTFRTFDNQTIHVPNNEIWGNVITNITANETRRVDMEFGVGYDDDFKEAERIIREVVEQHELVLKDPEPAIVMHELADSSVNIVCRPWAKTSDWWTVKTDVTRGVKQRFDQAGISIPYPQRDVHIYNVKADAGETALNA